SHRALRLTVGVLTMSSFFARQGPLHAPRMYREPEVIVDPSAECRRVTGGVRFTRLGDEVDHVIGEFIRALGAPFVRDEALEAVRGKLALQVIKVAPRTSEVVGRLAHGGAVSLDAP